MADEIPEAEVVSDLPNGPRQITVPKVQFNCGTTLESPFFWWTVGLISGLALVYFLRKR